MKLQYRAVVFDLDGTLVDSYEALLLSVNSALEAHGRAGLTIDQVRGMVGEGIERLLSRCFDGPAPEGAHDHFVKVYDEICCEKSRLLEDVEDTLGSLSRLGITMSVCTNKPTTFSRKILEALDAARYFEAIVGPDLAGARKPDARHVLYALEATGHRPVEALFVGDMPIDVEAAHAAGLDVAVIPTGSAEREPLAAANPDYLLAKFSDLIELIGVEES